jgi:hypothetical protein
MTQGNNFDPNSEGQYVPSSPTREKQNNFSRDDVGEYTPPVATFSPEWQQDVASQAGHGLVQGTAQLLALPGTAVQAGSWLKNKAQDVYGNYQEATGSKPKGSTAQETALRKAQQEAAMTPGEKTGISANLLGLELPTSAGIDWILKKQFGFNPAEPKTDTGRYVKAAMEMVPATVLTGGGGLAARVGIGALSGASALAAEDAANAFNASDTTKAIAGLSGALVGGGIGSAGAGRLSKLLSPGNAALKDLAGAASKDIAGNQSNITRLVDPATGLPKIADTMVAQNIQGPNVRRAVGRAVGSNEEAGTKLGALNENLEARANQAPGNLKNVIGDTTGVTAAAPELADAVKAANQQHITNLYNISHANPNASNMVSPDLINAMQGNMVRSFAKEAESLATAHGSDIIPAALDAHNNLVGGNLAYYDRISKGLREAAVGLQPAQARDLEIARDKLLKAIHPLVPEYAAARGAAFDSFGQQNSVILGSKAIEIKDPFKINKLKQAFEASPGEHQEMFKQGLGYSLQNIAETNGPQALLKVIQNPVHQDLFKATIGMPALEAIQGRAIADKLLSNMKPYIPLETPAGRSMDIVRGGLGVNALTQLFTGDVVSAGLHAIPFAGAKLVELASHFQNDRKATAILRLISSTDPKDMQMFYNMVKNDPSTRSTIQKISEFARASALRNQVVQGQINEQSPDDRAPRKTGGKVSDSAKHERLLGRLMALTEKAKRTEEASTKPLLNAPDEAIVHALHVANAAI